jgi:hypothetical protein
MSEIREFKISELQKVSFSVLKKNEKKFFAVFVRRLNIQDPLKKFYENALYFERLSVDVLSLGSKVEICRGGNLIDDCIIQLKESGGVISTIPEFTFKKFNGRNRMEDKMHLDVQGLEEGDVVTIDWLLNDIELQQINNFLKDKIIKTEDVPMYVEEYFINRVGFNQAFDSLFPFFSFFSFTAYCSVLGHCYYV